MSVINVNIKWGKTQLKDVPLNTSESPSVFKEKILELTGVPVDRQKILIPKCPQLKNDSDWSKFPNLKEGVNIMLIGSADVIDKSVVPQEEVAVMEVEESNHLPPGLANLDNTCYFNSSVQVISSLDLVRKSLFQLQATNANAAGNDGDKRLSQAFQRTVTDLRNATKTVYPFELVHTFRMAFPIFDQKGDDGRYMQQDAEECFSQFLQSLSRYLPPISSPHLPNENNAISQLFSGQFDVTMRTLRLDGSVEESKMQEKFLKLSCHIQNDTSFLQQALENSLNEKISGEGDVTYIEKVSRISKLPYYLPIQYVRFFWKSDKNVRAKILKPVDVPLELDVYQICSDELKEKLKVKRDAESLPSVAGASESPHNTEEILENQTGRYELTAVISHKGRSADGGHYVAWVRDKGDDWYLFDDSNVSIVKTKDIKQLSGHGGADWHIAYVCIYTTKN